MSLRWDKLSKVAAQYGVLYVALTLLFAFMTGATAFAAIFGHRFLPHRSVAAFTWVSLPSGVICTLLLGYILAKVVTELARLAEREK